MTDLPPDTELVARLRAGDEDAFALVVDAWSPGLLRLARTVLADRESAAEVVQETWLAVMRGIDGFAGRSALRTWVSTILLNAARRQAGRDGRTVPWSSVVDTDEDGPTVAPDRFRGPGEDHPGDWRVTPAPWTVPTPEQAVLHAETRARITAAVASLPVRQRLVLTLRDVQGHAPEEVCSMMEISAANERVLLHRARAAVRGRLAGEDR